MITNLHLQIFIKYQGQWTDFVRNATARERIITSRELWEELVAIKDLVGWFSQDTIDHEEFRQFIAELKTKCDASCFLELAKMFPLFNRYYFLHKQLSLIFKYTQVLVNRERENAELMRRNITNYQVWIKEILTCDYGAVSLLLDVLKDDELFKATAISVGWDDIIIPMIDELCKFSEIVNKSTQEYNAYVSDYHKRFVIFIQKDKK